MNIIGLYLVNSNDEIKPAYRFKYGELAKVWNGSRDMTDGSYKKVGRGVYNLYGFRDYACYLAMKVPDEAN